VSLEFELTSELFQALQKCSCETPWVAGAELGTLDCLKTVTNIVSVLCQKNFPRSILWFLTCGTPISFTILKIHGSFIFTSDMMAEVTEITHLFPFHMNSSAFSGNTDSDQSTTQNYTLSNSKWRSKVLLSNQCSLSC
jgi:hypothetical protein